MAQVSSPSDAAPGTSGEASSTEGTGIEFSWDGSDEMTEVCGEMVLPNFSPTGPSAAKSEYRHGDESCLHRPRNGLLQQPAKKRFLD